MSSRALGASASWRPRSTAVLLEARRRLPERPRRRSWVIGRSSRWLGFQFTYPTNITTAPVSSSKFDFNIRLTIALQLLERFRLWVNRYRIGLSALLPLFP